MIAERIDGKAASQALVAQVAAEAARLHAARGVVPGLAVILVGDDAASAVYVRKKACETRAAGMASFEHRLPATASQHELLRLVERLNAEPAVHGILVQLPLPSQIDTGAVLQAVDPAKDVDGFHPINAGLLSIGKPRFVPCTPLGCLMLLRQVRPDLEGMHAVVIGRSNIVGKPMAQLLLGANCTVTVGHSRTRDLPAITRHADIVVAAVGRAAFVRGDWLKPGCTIIDVGINRVAVPGEGGKARLVGDVAYEEAAEVAGAITPVPGGVGPMTVACLLLNVLRAAAQREDWAVREDFR